MGAVSESNTLITLESGGDYHTSQYCFVVVAADGQVDPAGAGVRADGVLYNKPDAAGKAADVAISGIVKMKSGAAVTRGAMVKSDGSGRAIDATTTTFAMGRALEACSNADEIIMVLLVSPGHNALS